jgi:hypothetical protein
MFMIRGIARCAPRLLVVLWLVAACSDDSGGANLGIDDGASRGEEKSLVVPAGRMATLALTTGASIAIPEGALDRDVKLAMRRPSDGEAGKLTSSVSARYQLASAPYVITPHRTSFSKSVSVTLPVARGQTSRLVVAWLEDENDRDWKLVGRPTVSGTRATLSVDHFSVLVLLEDMDLPSGDAGTDLDGGLADAAPGSDAGDGAVPGTDAAAPTGLVARIRARLAACGLIAREGDVSFVPAPYESTRESCVTECHLAEPCSEFADDLCNTGAARPTFEACYATCTGHPETRSCLDLSGIPIQASVCDTVPSCADGLDEASCPAGAFFTCAADGQRFPIDVQCDGHRICSDGSDELGCPAATRFACADGQNIVPVDAVCDGSADCGDGSDEASCTGQIFRCADGSDVLNVSAVCDLFNDCDDGSDEPARCLAIQCPNPN